MKIKPVKNGFRRRIDWVSRRDGPQWGRVADAEMRAVVVTSLDLGAGSR